MSHTCRLDDVRFVHVFISLLFRVSVSGVVVCTRCFCWYYAEQQSELGDSISGSRFDVCSVYIVDYVPLLLILTLCYRCPQLVVLRVS